TFKTLIRRNSDAQIQVSGLGASRARPALAGYANTRTVAHTGVNSAIDSSSMGVLANREAAHRSAVCVLQLELDLLFQVLTALRAPPCTAPGPMRAAS